MSDKYEIEEDNAWMSQSSQNDLIANGLYLPLRPIIVRAIFHGSTVHESNSPFTVFVGVVHTYDTYIYVWNDMKCMYTLFMYYIFHLNTIRNSTSPISSCFSLQSVQGTRFKYYESRNITIKFLVLKRWPVVRLHTISYLPTSIWRTFWCSLTLVAFARLVCSRFQFEWRLKFLSEFKST